MMKSPVAVFLFSLATLDPCHGKVLWSSSPATYGPRESDKYILKTGYPVGNGKLGAIPFGAPGAEKVNLNVDSLWSGGPFEVENYSGGNPSGPIYEALPGIQAEIFENGTGNMSALLGNGTAYGSYRVLGNLTVEMENVGTYTEYRRQLDLSTGVHSTTFKARNDGDNDDDDGSAEYLVSVFCSYPDQVCVYDVSSDSILPNMTVGFENILVDQSLLDHSCGEGVARFSGITQAGSPEGMKYAAIARVAAGTTTSKGCSSGGSLELVPNGKRISIIISAETNYDQNHGNAESGWSFKGSDPEPIIEELSAAGSNKYYEELLERHIADYQELQGAFSLILPDPNGSEAVETGELLANYSRDYFSNSTNSTGAGDPFVESLLFDLARHLLISSSRPGSLPANLQGRWAEQLDPAWSADYHANINVQMNYWPADQTGLSVTQQPLWDHIEATWATRGRETARLLYDADGWVVHNEMNIFGFSAMKEDAGWANYAAAGAWIMQHVWDDFDYTRDADRLRRQGYPLLKGVADFWLSMLREDGFSGDGSLVAVPCNSPEHGPTTFGCAHYQQLVHQVFHAVLAAQEHLAPDASSDQEREGGEDEAEDNKAFVAAVTSALARLDKGYHISSWGGLKEWKLPESYGFDAPSTHRHLSHLSGWHPGHAVSSLSAGYASPAAQEAVRRTLLSRGDGDAPDANAGWAKVWRAACWARLNDTARAHEHLRHAAAANLAPSANGLSMYAGADPPFQIDANFGFAGAVLSMLVVDLPSADVGPGARERSVVLGPAIPPSWGGGKVKGLRLRGGWVVDFGWDEDGVVDGVEVVSRGKGAAAEKVRVVDVKGRHLALLEVEGEM